MAPARRTLILAVFIHVESPGSFAPRIAIEPSLEINQTVRRISMRGLIRRRSVIINDRLPFQRCLDESIVRRLKASHEPEVQPSLARQLRPLIQDVASALITPRDANLSLFKIGR